MKARIPHTSRALLLAALSVLIAAPVALAQQNAARPSHTETTTFDAVTIKPSIPGSRGRSWGFNGDTYALKNAALAQVILQAYLDGPSSPDRLKSAPAWVMEDFYDITAKVDDKTADQWKDLDHPHQATMVAPLLRAMLEQRCKIAVHTDATEISGYALIVSKHGIKNMRLVPPDEPETKGAQRFTGGGLIVHMGGPPRADGKRFLSFVHTSMASLAASTGPMYVVVDRTGLQGKYDFDLSRINMDPPDGDASAPRPDFPHTFDWAALGLEIRPIKIPMQNVVIDHVEKPSPN